MMQINLFNNLLINKFLFSIFFLLTLFSSLVQCKNSDRSFVDQTYAGNNDTDSLAILSEKQKISSLKSIYLQFNTSGLFSSLSDWKSQLHLSDGSHPSSSSIVFGAEGGWIINRYIQIGIGCEFFFTTKVAANETPGDQVNCSFYYGSIKASTGFESVPEFFLFAGLDAGTLKATETIENYFYSGRNIDRTGSTTAYRFTIGAQYYLIENWSIIGNAGYLLGNVKSITADGRNWPNFSLDLSGITLRFAVNYHFPL